MAYNLHTAIPVSFQPGEDLSNNQFQFVRLGTDGLLYHSDMTSYALGVLTDTPSSEAQGQYAGTVDIVGVTRLAVYGAYPIGTWLQPDATGYGMSIADASAAGVYNNNYIRAWSLQAANNQYDVVSVQLLDLQGPASGSVGSQGPQGSQGVTGVQGQGSTGLTGYTGVQGLQGNTGVQGRTGIQGTTGVA
jgi:Collagen triple helix repeat (20 copies).